MIEAHLLVLAFFIGAIVGSLWTLAVVADDRNLRRADDRPPET